MFQLYTTTKICWLGPSALLPAPCPAYTKSSPRDDVVGGDLAAHSLNRYSNLWNSAYMLACVYWPCRWWTCSYFPKSMSTLVRSKHHWDLMMSTWSCNCFVWSVHGHACSSLQVALFLASAFKRLHIMQPYFLQRSASVLSATTVCIHINELADCTWVQQICNCFAWSVQEHIRPFFKCL